jgi:hypothetical protein
VTPSFSLCTKTVFIGETSVLELVLTTQSATLLCQCLSQPLCIPLASPRDGDQEKGGSALEIFGEKID